MKPAGDQPAPDYWVSSHGNRGLAAQSIGMVVNGDVLLSSQLTRSSGSEPPSGTPLHWSVPPRNVAFTGRDEVLSALHTQLAGGTTALVAAPHTLHGLGGVGKTQLALEYAHRYREYYELVWWIDAEQTELISAALTRLAKRIGLPVGEDADAVATLKEALGRGVPTPRWLLVFDNADAPSALHAFLLNSPGHTLITSRNPDWAGLAEVLPVSVFARDESIGHLCRRVRGLSQEDADRVAGAVGDLPLAVEIAAAWLASSGMPVQTYVEQLHAGAPRALGADPIRRFGATWNVSISLLREQEPASAGLLELCACFAPEPISLDLLYSEETRAALAEYDPGLTDIFMLGKVIQAVGRYALALVDPGTNSLQVHRLVQAVVRAGMDTRAQEIALHWVHRILAGARPSDGDTDSPANWPRFNTIWPHLVPSHAMDCDEPEVRELVIDRVRHLRSFAALDRAEQLAARITAQWSERLGGEDEDDWLGLRRQLLTLRFHHANVYRAQGRYVEAHAMDEDVHARQCRLLGRLHPQTLMTAASLGADLRGLGRFEESLRLRRQTFHSFREVFGAADPRSLAIATNMARDLREIGDHRGAVELLREVAEESPKVLRSDRPEHLRVARSLAVSLRRDGQLQEARELSEQTFRRYQDRYGAEAADSLACALDLAAVLGACGDYEAARDLTAMVRAGYRRLFGDDHVLTRLCENNLALHLRGCGDTANAVRLGTQAVDGLRTALGPSHPHTLNALANLANARGEAGDTAVAVELGQAAHTGLAERYSPDHPDALAGESNLAVTLHVAEPDRAERLRRHALAGLSRVLGREHPSTRASREWRRIDRELEAQAT